MFDYSSRYANTPVQAFIQADGTAVAYIKRRFLPQAETIQAIQHVSIVAGDRIDNVSAKTLGDPLQFWRICDANDAMYPPDLTYYPGTVLSIAAPAPLPNPVPTG
jgi:hypothetical protein